jgi:hypothetical protein
MRNFMIYTFAKYYLGDHVRRMRWAGHVAHMDERRGMYRILLGKPE